MTLIVNFFGGPGAGKSTLASGLFFRLKQNRVNCELVTEFAKILTWENRKDTLECQPYIFGRQLYNLEMLLNKVDVVVTDSPICLSLFYKACNYPESFGKSVIDIFNTFNNINYYIDRGTDDVYDNIGRKENTSLAESIDHRIVSFLKEYNIPYNTVLKKYSNIENILGEILNKIKNKGE